MVFSSLIASVAMADTTKKNITNMGFSKGVSYKPVVPIKKVTFESKKAKLVEKG